MDEVEELRRDLAHVQGQLLGQRAVIKALLNAMPHADLIRERVSTSADAELTTGLFRTTPEAVLRGYEFALKLLGVPPG